MRKSILLFVVILTTLTSYIAKAETTTTAYTIETVPNVYVKDLRQHVSDPDGLLSIAARDSINRMFTALEQKTGIQAMVVMLPSIGDDDVFEFSQSLFRYWGIGDKEKNNGLLITYVADQRIIRFHTGYGLEGFLTDALGKRIQTTYMIPAFKQGDTDTGMVKGIRAVYKVLEDSMDPNKKQEEGTPWMALLMLAIIIAAASYLVWYSDKQTRMCKACKKPGALNRMSTDYYYDSQRMKHRKDVFICGNCGHVEVRDKIVDDGNHHNNDLLKGIIIGSILSNMRGGGGGGGGFTGGNFGGGSTGGGGSSSSW